MSDEEILKKAIVKARKNGWNPICFIDLGWEIHNNKLWYRASAEDRARTSKEFATAFYKANR